MTEVVLFIYLSGVIASMIVWSIRQFKGEASLVETMYCPVVFLLSWIYVFEIFKGNYIQFYTNHVVKHKVK